MGHIGQFAATLKMSQRPYQTLQYILGPTKEDLRGDLQVIDHYTSTLSNVVAQLKVYGQLAKVKGMSTNDVNTKGINEVCSAFTKDLQMIKENKMAIKDIMYHDLKLEQGSTLSDKGLDLSALVHSY